MRKEKLAVNLKNEVFGCSASSPKQNNLVEIGNRKHGIHLKAVGSPDEKLNNLALLKLEVQKLNVLIPPRLILAKFRYL